MAINSIMVLSIYIWIGYFYLKKKKFTYVFIDFIGIQNLFQSFDGDISALKTMVLNSLSSMMISKIEA